MLSNMPRKSLRCKTLELMQAKVQQLRMNSYFREVMGEDDSIADDELINHSETLQQMNKFRYYLDDVYLMIVRIQMMKSS